jgi:hypothetical protein
MGVGVGSGKTREGHKSHALQHHENENLSLVSWLLTQYGGGDHARDQWERLIHGWQ